jgi:hypothetical protein
MKTLKLISSILIAILVVGLYFAFDAHVSAASFTAASAGAVALRDRQIFNKLLTENKAQGIIPSPSYLRIEQTLSNSKGTYEFRLAKTDNESITEVKLDRNDTFVVTDLAVYLVCETTAKAGKAVLQTYVNQIVFPVVAGFTPSDLEAIYNGRLELKIGQKVNIETLSLQNFRVVPETQQSAVTNLGNRSVNDAKYPMGALLTLKGNMDTRITITFPTFAAMEIAAVTVGTTHKLVFHPYGYLLRGASN